MPRQHNININTEVGGEGGFVILLTSSYPTERYLSVLQSQPSQHLSLWVPHVVGVTSPS